VHRSESIRCRRAIVDGQHSAADVQVEDVVLPLTPNAAYSMAAIMRAALGPWPWTVSAETPAAAAIFAKVVRA
jgi:hypothetical protein